MPTVATQTEITMTTETGYLGWLKDNRDVADGIPIVKQHSPKEKLTEIRRQAYWNSFDMKQ